MPARLQAFIALEARARVDGDATPQIHTQLARFLGALFLLLHRDIEPHRVNGETTLTGDIRGEIRREAISVIELEDGLTVDLFALQTLDRVFEQRHAIRERLGETLLFLFQHTLNMHAISSQLRIRLTHLALEHGHELVEESVLDA